MRTTRRVDLANILNIKYVFRESEMNVQAHAEARKRNTDRRLLKWRGEAEVRGKGMEG